MGRPLLELERGVGQSSERNRKPKVDRPVGKHTRQRCAFCHSEASQHRHQHELDDAQAARGDRNGSQDVGEPVGGKQVHR